MRINNLATVFAAVALFLSYAGSVSAEPTASAASPDPATVAAAHRTVETAYLRELGREPDPDGLEAFTRAMIQDGHDAEWVRETLASSSEGHRARGHRRFIRRVLIAGLVFFLSALAWIWRCARIEKAAQPGGSPDAFHKRVLRLTALLFLLRGIAIQCLSPPFEGADEYQHVAYIEHILENHGVPVYGQATVPKSLYRELVKYPHSSYDCAQTAVLGCQPYAWFYDQPPAQTAEPDIMLYQAQHPPLYYLAAAPVYALASSVSGVRGAIYLLRIVNITLAALAITLFLTPLRDIARGARLYTLTAAAVAMQPMFMTYVSRVANDALALTFAGGAICLLAQPRRARRPGLTYALAGLCIGLGVLTKMTALSILPAAVVYLLSLAFLYRSLTRRQALAGIGWLLLGYLLVCLPYHLWSLRAFGTLLPAQETIRNAAAGRSFLDVLGLVRIHHIKEFFLDRLILNNLWTSGWSFLLADSAWMLLYKYTVFAVLGGAIAWGVRCARARSGARCIPSPSLLLCALIIGATFAAAYAHALNSIFAHGSIVTPSYYVMIAFPALLIGMGAAAAGYGQAVAGALLLTLTAVFTATELHSLLWVAAPHWAATDDWHTAAARLASIHPAFPAPAFFPAMYGLALIPLGWLVAQALRPARGAGPTAEG